MPRGPATGTLRLSHLAGSGNVAFESVTVRVSYDSGRTWQEVPVTDQGSGSYALLLNVPRHTDGFGALQVSARDALGGTFDQTIQHAFAAA